MDWAGLHAFVAVAEHGGFSAAAEQLHLTQPAVSKRIALLEDSLQSRLFDRLGRQVVLTEAGRLLLPRARQMLAEAEAARRALQDLGQDIGGQRVGEQGNESRDRHAGTVECGGRWRSTG